MGVQAVVTDNLTIVILSDKCELTVPQAQSVQRDLGLRISELREELRYRSHQRLLERAELMKSQGFGNGAIADKAGLNKTQMSRLVNGQWERIGSIETIEGHLARVHAAIDGIEAQQSLEGS